MQMTTTPTPPPYILLDKVEKATPITTVAGYLAAVNSWLTTNIGDLYAEGALSRVWYRGVGEMRAAAFPGVFRDDVNCTFTTQATSARSYGTDVEDRRLNLNHRARYLDSMVIHAAAVLW